MQTTIALTIVALCAGLVLRGLLRTVLPGRRAKTACGCSGGCPALKTRTPVLAPVPVDRQRPAA